MEAAISSIEVEVSSAACACPWAPCMMSRAFAEISPAEEATCTEASWMLSTTRRRLPTISLRLRPRVPTSSSLWASRLTMRSPLATEPEARTMFCSGLSQRPITAQPSAKPTPITSAASSRASTIRRRCTSRRVALEMATSTPPFTDSVTAAGAAPSSSLIPEPPLELVTGARKSSTGSPSVVNASRSSRAAAGAPGRSRIDRPAWARTAPLASRIMAPTTSERSPSPPASTAPSRNWARSGLSSVRTPYFALKARLLATYRPRLTIWSRRTASPATRS